MKMILLLYYLIKLRMNYKIIINLFKNNFDYNNICQLNKNPINQINHIVKMVM